MSSQWPQLNHDPSTSTFTGPTQPKFKVPKDTFLYIPSGNADLLLHGGTFRLRSSQMEPFIWERQPSPPGPHQKGRQTTCWRRGLAAPSPPPHAAGDEQVESSVPAALPSVRLRYGVADSRRLVDSFSNPDQASQPASQPAHRSPTPRSTPRSTHTAW